MQNWYWNSRRVSDLVDFIWCPVLEWQSFEAGTLNQERQSGNVESLTGREKETYGEVQEIGMENVYIYLFFIFLIIRIWFFRKQLPSSRCWRVVVSLRAPPGHIRYSSVFPCGFTRNLQDNTSQTSESQDWYVSDKVCQLFYAPFAVWHVCNVLHKNFHRSNVVLGMWHEDSNGNY